MKQERFVNKWIMISGSQVNKIQVNYLKLILHGCPKHSSLTGTAVVYVKSHLTMNKKKNETQS